MIICVPLQLKIMMADSLPKPMSYIIILVYFDIILSLNQDPMSSTSKPREGSAGQSSQKKKALDRFIPHTVARNLFNAPPQPQQPSHYQSLLNHNLINQQPKILHFHDQQAPKENRNPNLPGGLGQESNFKKMQRLPSNPYKVLPATYLKDDFYLNLVDYSESGNIGVGLQGGLFVWSGCATRVSKVHEFKEEESICSLQFLTGSSKVAMGLNRGQLALLDLQRQKIERFEGAHLGRVGSVGCGNNLICSGGRDGYVSIWDPRQESQVFRYKAHDQQICGLKLAPAWDMVATGGNDNKLSLFSLKKMEMLAEWGEHRAAVKAIGFNPSDPTLTSGGGSADRKLRVFSLHSLQLLNEVDTGSQVCNMVYSPVSDELLTTHGYSLNQLTLWKWSSNGDLQKIDSVMGHKKRVLYLSGEHRGGRVVTGAGDEQLRLWKVFDEHRSQPTEDLR